MPQDSQFSPTASALIDNFEKQDLEDTDKKITVNILVSKVASLYEKVRTAMDYGNEETILRRAIERILKRRLFLEPDSKSLAESTVRELIWGGYFADATVPESIINKVALSIRLHLALKDRIIEKRTLPNVDVFDLMIQLISSEIHTILLPIREKEAMSNFMFHTLRNSVEILDDSKQTRDVQVFIAVRKNFARDDIAFLRYKLFTQIFGKLTEEHFEVIAENFADGYREIEYQLSYPRKDRIFYHIKRHTAPFLILNDLLLQERANIRGLVGDEETFRKRVVSLCQQRYKSIKNKVRTAILRSFIFILITKAIVGLFVEGTFERIFFGNIQWVSIAINTTVPPLLMVAVGLSIRTPDGKNSEKIYEDIRKLLFDENPQIAPTISVKLKVNSARTIKEQIFSLLWLLSIILIFGLIVFALSKLHFNILSQGIFLFFIAIVSFLSYRIYQTANTYRVISKQNIFTPILDFFFVPIIRVGRRFTEGISQINFLLLIVDFIIEAPFKALVGFFEQWFSFLATKREELE